MKELFWYLWLSGLRGISDYSAFRMTEFVIGPEWIISQTMLEVPRFWSWIHGKYPGREMRRDLGVFQHRSRFVVSPLFWNHCRLIAGLQVYLGRILSIYRIIRARDQANSYFEWTLNNKSTVQRVSSYGDSWIVIPVITPCSEHGAPLPCDSVLSCCFWTLENSCGRLWFYWCLLHTCGSGQWRFSSWEVLSSKALNRKFSFWSSGIFSGVHSRESRCIGCSPWFPRSRSR